MNLTPATHKPAHAVKNISRRRFNASLAAGAMALALTKYGGRSLAAAANSTRSIAAGPFEATWESLVQYQSLKN